MGKTSVFVGEKLLEAEARCGLFALKVNNICLWQYVRYTCMVKILEEITGVETVCRSMSAVRKQKTQWEFKEWLKHQQFLAHKKDILVLNHPRRVKEGRYYRCFVTDWILENLEYSYYVYESEYGGMHYTPVRTRHLKYVNVDGIRKLVKYDEQRYKKELSDFVNKVICAFEGYCQVTLSAALKQFLCSHIFNACRELFYDRIWAGLVLKLVRPRLVIVTVGYSFFVQVMVAEAKRLRIPTVELQHARIGDTHLAYNYIYRGEIESFCDYMFVYGAYDKTAARYPILADHVIAVGYPELERKARCYVANKIRKQTKNRRKVITFLSAPGPGEIILKYALELRKKEELKNYRMIFKLHPCEYRDWKAWYPQLEHSGLEIVSDNQHDIYYYLGHSDYVVGISSTALFEAMEFDTQIFVIKDGDYRKAEYLYQNSNACLVETVEQLAEGLLITNDKKLDKKDNKYFTTNSIQNIQKQIERLIKN